jgi:FkbM family methyltransferase
VKPGNAVLDIGRNIGAHTLPLAHLVGPHGRVIAFEPTAYAIRKMRANIALNAGLGELKDGFDSRTRYHMRLIVD